MLFHPNPLPGSYLIDLEKKGDERGFFARVFCTKEFENLGLESSFIQVNNSLSAKKGTLRGIHYQLAPKGEVKLVRCVKGSLYDVIIDLRKESKTFGQWFGAELSAENRRMMYVPKGFGHAFLTLEDDSEALYMVSESYSPEHERGIRWNDQRFAIKWPISPEVISEKDNSHRDFDVAYHLS